MPKLIYFLIYNTNQNHNRTRTQWFPNSSCKMVPNLSCTLVSSEELLKGFAPRLPTTAIKLVPVGEGWECQCLLKLPGWLPGTAKAQSYLEEWAHKNGKKFQGRKISRCVSYQQLKYIISEIDYKAVIIETKLTEGSRRLF
jgi:hypothetical protein